MKYPNEWPGIMDSAGQFLELVDVNAVLGKWIRCRPVIWGEVMNQWVATFVPCRDAIPLTPTAREMLAIARGCDWSASSIARAALKGGKR